MMIAFQGIDGSYSNIILKRYFGSSVNVLPCTNFRRVFSAVREKRADLAILPFENSIAGSVTENYDLLLKNDLKIIGETCLDIRHCLLAKKGAIFDKISEVYSHPHAIAQCGSFLDRHRMIGVPYYDTAMSAKKISDVDSDDSLTSAAIASKECAQIYGLEVIRERIGDVKDNVTRFLILAREEDVPKGIEKKKTTLAFKTKHFPGALVKCLECLSKRSINMSKLESRPVPENMWEYIFYVDLDHNDDYDMAETRIDEAIAEMKQHTSMLKVLGSYSARK